MSKVVATTTTATSTRTSTTASVSTKPSLSVAKSKLEEINGKIETHLEQKHDPSAVCATLMELFVLLFDFQQEGQLDVAKLCGVQVVAVLGDYMTFRDVVEQTMLVVSTICNHEQARIVLVRNTEIMPLCINALSTTARDDPGLRERLLGCLSILLKGFVRQAMDCNILHPLVDLLGDSENLTDIRLATGLVLGLIEPGDPKIGIKFLFNGIVPLLMQNVARTCPEGASAAEQASYRYLHAVCLRGVASILRHQPLARRLATQFFDSNTGRFHLHSVVQHCDALHDVCRWFFAAEILVWLADEPSCHPALLQVNAKSVLRKVVSQADPYAKWPALMNQSVVATALQTLFSAVEKRHIFAREQQGFLALWMNRYAVGRPSAMAEDALKARERLSAQWQPFATMMLASADEAVRHHAHATLQGLWGESNRSMRNMIKVKLESSSSSSSLKQQAVEANERKKQATLVAAREHRESVVMMEHILGTEGLANALPPAPVRQPEQPDQVEVSLEVTRRADESTILLEYLIGPLGLDMTEERQVMKCLSEAKLPLHVLLRPGISIESIGEGLTSLSVGTRLVIMDGIVDLRKEQERARSSAQFVNTFDVEQKAIPPPLDGLKPDPTPKCFISYHWAQKQQAQQLKEILHEVGVQCWIDEDKTQESSLEFEKVDQGLTSCKVVLSCLSPEYVGSVDCNREMLLATARKKTIVPTILCQLGEWPPRGIMGPLLSGKFCLNLGGGPSSSGVVEDEDSQQTLTRVVQKLL